MASGIPPIVGAATPMYPKLNQPTIVLGITQLLHSGPSHMNNSTSTGPYMEGTLAAFLLTWAAPY